MTEREPITGSSRDYGATAAPPAVGFADFSPTELYNLSEGIAENVNSVNSGLRSLEKMMKQIGGPHDSVQLRDKIHDCQQSVNACVSATARDLQRLGVVVRRGDKPQKLQVERLTQAFKDALAKYSAVQKEVSEKMAAHMPRPARVRNDPAALEQQAIADDEEAALVANQQAQGWYCNDPAALEQQAIADDEEAALVANQQAQGRYCNDPAALEQQAIADDEEAALVANQQAQGRYCNDPAALEQQAIADDEEAALVANQQAQARLVQFETSMLVEREAYMSKIEADVLDVGQIMRELAAMVSVQGQTVDTVASHIEDASAQVESGVDELAKAAEYQRRYRRKMFILILIALIVGIIFVVWIVKAFK
ncbi:syntaxin-7 [Ostrinia nubilalis]|uniref:syntaxin-7 n=1 Tax=Ostrinia nubilalis TaxID=29057 RepID=UPI0030822153